jgi:hypothetical protein
LDLLKLSSDFFNRIDAERHWLRDFGAVEQVPRAAISLDFLGRRQKVTWMVERHRFVGLLGEAL